MLNINYGHNCELMDKCHVLEEGIEQGIELGIERSNRLTRILIEQNRMKDMERAI